MKIQLFKTTILLSFFLQLSCSDYTGSILPALSVAEKSQQCNDSKSTELQDPNVGDFSERKMLANIGLNVIAKNVHNFSEKVSVLKAKVSDYCDDLENNVIDSPAEDVVKKQWVEAMMAYHLIDATAVGPLSDNTRYYADHIYSWPIVSLCGIDNDVASQALTGSPATLTSVNRKGLAALEYLLFTPPGSESCPLSIVNKNVVEWLKRAPEQRKKDRCVRIKSIANDLEIKAQEVWRAWDPSRGHFTKSLVDCSRYGSTSDAINAITDSLFSLEKVKDLRLGKPLGKTADCSTADKKCPSSVEHIWSGLSFPAMMMRLEGFKSAFYGSVEKDQKAFGLDDYLNAKGFSVAVKQIDEVLRQNVEELRILNQEGTLAEQVQKMNVNDCTVTTLDSPVVPLCHFYLSVKKLSNLFKLEVLTALSLQAPAALQGDSD